MSTSDTCEVASIKTGPVPLPSTNASPNASQSSTASGGSGHTAATVPLSEDQVNSQELQPPAGDIIQLLNRTLTAPNAEEEHAPNTSSSQPPAPSPAQSANTPSPTTTPNISERLKSFAKYARRFGTIINVCSTVVLVAFAVVMWRIATSTPTPQATPSNDKAMQSQLPNASTTHFPKRELDDASSLESILGVIFPYAGHVSRTLSEGDFASKFSTLLLPFAACNAVSFLLTICARSALKHSRLPMWLLLCPFICAVVMLAVGGYLATRSMPDALWVCTFIVESCQAPLQFHAPGVVTAMLAFRAGLRGRWVVCLGGMLTLGILAVDIHTVDAGLLIVQLTIGWVMLLFLLFTGGVVFLTLDSGMIYGNLRDTLDELKMEKLD